MVNYLLPLPLLCEWGKYWSFAFTPTQIDKLQNICSIIIPWIGYWLMKQFFWWRIFAVLQKILWNMNIMLQFLVFICERNSPKTKKVLKIRQNSQELPTTWNGTSVSSTFIFRIFPDLAKYIPTLVTSQNWREKHWVDGTDNFFNFLMMRHRLTS